MGFLDELEDEGPGSEHAAGRDSRIEEGRTTGIWALAIVNVLLAVLAVLAVLFLSSAQSYVVNESAEFGSELDAAVVGLLVMRIACYALMGGFLLSALGMVSMTRVGFRVQYLWALLLCPTLIGAAYGVPVILFLRRAPIRARYFPYVASVS